VGKGALAPCPPSIYGILKWWARALCPPYGLRHGEPTGRVNARPMTGSAASRLRSLGLIKLVAVTVTGLVAISVDVRYRE